MQTNIQQDRPRRTNGYAPRRHRVEGVPARDFSQGKLPHGELCSYEMVQALKWRRQDRLEKFWGAHWLTALTNPRRFYPIVRRMEQHIELAEYALQNEKVNQIEKAWNDHPGGTPEDLEAIGKTSAYWEGRLESGWHLLSNEAPTAQAVSAYPDDYRQGRSQAKWVNLMAASGWRQGLPFTTLDDEAEKASR